MRTTVGQQLTLVRPRACGAHHTPNHALHSVHCFAAQRATARGACMHAVYSDRESCCCQRCQGSRTRRMRTRLCDSAVDSAALISAMPRRTPHRPSAQPTAGGRVRLASAGRPAHPNGSEPWPPEGTSAMTLRTSISGGRSRSTRGRSVGSARPRSPRAHTKACAPTRRHPRAHRHARTRARWAHAASTGACARSLRMRTSSGGRARSARLSTRSCRDTQPLSLRAAIAPPTAAERCCAAPLAANCLPVQANAAHAGRAEHYYRLAIKVGRATRGHCSTSLHTHAHTQKRTHARHTRAHAHTDLRARDAERHSCTTVADGAPLTRGGRAALLRRRICA